MTTKKEDISKILREYINNASPDQLRELADLMGSRKKKQHGIQDMANSTAAQISGQLKVTDRVIKNTARNLVATLARQYKPDLSDREVDAIVNELVPDRKKSRSLPSPIMLTMIEHFVGYSRGRMTQQEISGLPAGWQKKYWECFSPEIRQAISDYLKGNTGEVEFWKSVRNHFRTE